LVFVKDAHHCVKAAAMDQDGARGNLRVREDRQRFRDHGKSLNAFDGDCDDGNAALASDVFRVENAIDESHGAVLPRVRNAAPSKAY
jgi:hypothetical protein